MAFTLGNIAAKDGNATTIGGGLLAADITGGGAGPWIIFHSLTDGLAGVNKVQITSASAMKVDGSGVTQPVSGTVAATQSGVWTMSAAAAITPVVSSILESNHIMKGSAGTLYSFQANSTSVGGYVMLFNATSAPADGAVTPIKVWQIGAQTTLGIGCNPPLAFSIGIVLVFSTTGPFTKTASATAYFSGEVA
jgi:nucleoside phosphorylase